MTDKCSVLGLSCSIECDRPPCKSRLAGLSGTTGTAVILFGMLVSALSYPGFDFGISISQLGSTAASPRSDVFNACLVAGGLITAFFPAMFGGATRSRALAICLAAAGFAAGFGAVLDGLIPVDIDSTAHGVAAGIAFAGIAVTTAVMAVIIFQNDSKSIPVAFGFISLAQLAFFTLCIAIYFAAKAGLIAAAVFPIIEWASVLLSLASVLGMSIYELT